MQPTKKPLEPTWLPPPQPPSCLILAYRSTGQKGGTLIAGDVMDMATHLRRLGEPDGYRPAECLHCHHDVLHGHDFRERSPHRDSGVPAVTVRRYQCARCEATWCVLPGFLARLLWYAWPPIESVLWPDDAPSPSPPPPPPSDTKKVVEISPRVTVPRRTACRWRERMRSGARQLVQLLATVGGEGLDRLAAALGLDATRADLVLAYASAFEVRPGQRLSTLAAHLHRVEPGLRLG